MKKWIGVLLVIIFSSVVFSQNPNRQYLSHKMKDKHLEVYTSDGVYVFKPFSGNIIEAAFIPNGEVFDTQSWSVVTKPQKVELTIQESESAIALKTAGISAEITKNPFQITYYFKDRFLTSEKEGYIKTDTTEEIEFNLTDSEVLYGGGTRVLGMNRRGYRLELYNKAHYGYTEHSELMNYCIPMVLSSGRYAIHFDNAPIGFLDLDSKHNNTLKYETISGRMVYQVMAGDTWPQIIDAYTGLTGKQPLPPRWAFGNFSSRFGYHSEQETRMTVNKFLEDSIPLDVVVIDIYWFGPDIFGYMGNLEFWADSFPTPDRMIADFKTKGVKTVLVTEPFILTTSKRWGEAVDNRILATDSLGNPYTYDFYFGNTGLIDIFKPSAREWFWNIYKSFTERGVAGWWGDLGEPEVHPSGLQHVVGSADEVHNVYGHEWAKMIYEGYQKDFPDKRPFILMRSGAAGSQHYGMIPWTGDVDRSWGGLKPQNELSLQMGMQGLGYLHSDLGGFANGEVFDPELYTRWLQYGVFQPLFRPHAQEHIPAEPVFHDKKTKALAKQAIELRYSLLPYIYTMAFENSQTGMPFMRPLFFEEPENTNLWINSDTYLWGPDMLVSPVTEEGQKKMFVYFPEGSNWFDFYTNIKYEGGTSYKIKLVEDHIPVFVRGGAFIPMVDPVQTTDHYSTKNLTINYYFDQVVITSNGQMYDDDGETPDAYQKGKYEMLSFEAINNSDQIKIRLNDEIGADWSVPEREIKLIMHNFDKAPLLVEQGKFELPFIYSEEEHRLTITFSWMAGEETEITILP
jgi:alpha-glucosidase/oligosaccharide 4-alpha-D-glucosyltransferase